MKPFTRTELISKLGLSSALTTVPANAQATRHDHRRLGRRSAGHFGCHPGNRGYRGCGIGRHRKASASQRSLGSCPTSYCSMSTCPRWMASQTLAAIRKEYPFAAGDHVQRADRSAARRVTLDALSHSAPTTTRPNPPPLEGRPWKVSTRTPSCSPRFEHFAKTKGTPPTVDIQPTVPRDAEGHGSASSLHREIGGHRVVDRRSQRPRSEIMAKLPRLRCPYARPHRRNTCPPIFTRLLAERLDNLSPLHVCHRSRLMVQAIEPGHVPT